MPGFSGKIDSTLIVGVAFDGRTKPLLRLAQSLQERTCLIPRLVHVAESPYVPDYSYPGLDRRHIPETAFTAIHDETVKRAEGNFSEISQYQALRGKFTTCVVDAETPAHGIMREAEKNSASLILVAAAPHSHGHVPIGFSTALSVMHGAKQPVLVVRSDSILDLSRPRLKMLIVDDLNKETGSIAKTAMELAMALGKVDVSHMHVVTAPYRLLWQKVGEMVAAATLPGGAQFPENLTDEDLQIQVRLEERAGVNTDLFRAKDVAYETRVLHGDVADEVLKTAESYGADIVVFGQHRSVHHNPFSLGKVSWATMLASRSAVLVVPRSADS